uniref:Uncharacterized protein n=1 Tax=Oryza brachyantha TaxID=4533 RepID=J3L219_ORYBR
MVALSAPLLTPYKTGQFDLAHSDPCAWFQSASPCCLWPGQGRPRAADAVPVPGNVPQAHNAAYYTQRAAAGALLVAEAYAVSETARGYPDAPGLWSGE